MDARVVDILFVFNFSIRKLSATFKITEIQPEYFRELNIKYVFLKIDINKILAI